MRRLAFVVSICGMVLALLPLATVLDRPSFRTAAAGFGLVIVGIFVSIEFVAKQAKRR